MVSVMIATPKARCKDPRSFDPDLQQDSLLWSMLLQLARDQEQKSGFVATEEEPGLYGGLYLLRCDGTTLRPNEQWGYVLQPVIDPSGDCGWVSREDYQAEAKRLLDPHREKLLGLVGTLAKALGGRMPGEYADAADVLADS